MISAGTASTARRIGHIIALAVVLAPLHCPASAVAQQDRSKSRNQVAPAPLPGEAPEPNDPTSILDMDVEQLTTVDVKVPSMDIEVTSVSKQESTVGHSPAAVFVITNEMIRRSGATCVPEALRMAPGVEVARVKSNMWAISIRGFQNRYANKLLVLVDGRSVYDQLFSGVYWDVQDLVLDDIERIEVIRGPGGTLWGANAVNGVINIITKKAQKTQGVLATSGGGNLERAINQVRVGGNNGKGVYWRVYGKQTEIGNEYNNSLGSHDNWRMGRGGFRVDWELDQHQRDTVTVSGDFYGGSESDINQFPMPAAPFSWTTIRDEGVGGANLLAKWNRKISKQSDCSFQIYFDRSFRDQAIFREENTVFDVEWQHRFPLGERHNVLWGLGTRNIHLYAPNTNIHPDTAFVLQFDSAHETFRNFGGFIQDEITLREDELFLTVGTKIDRNSYTGVECQPSVRLLWAPDPRHVYWGAISRAVRTPSRLARSLFHYGPFYLPGPPLPTFVEFHGNTHLKAETMMAYELGYRAQTTDRFAWDVTAFADIYDEQAGWRRGIPVVGPTYIIAPQTYVNNSNSQLYGAEFSAQWAVTDAWRLSGSYSAVRMFAMGGQGLGIEGYPRNQTRLQSQWDLSEAWEFDMALRYVDNVVGQGVPSYLTMDLRLGWKPRKDLEIALVGTNLFDEYHPEFGTTVYEPEVTEIRRTVYAQMTWRR
ncbi:MAG: TonB-dependent receptor [Pirellulales bacterium]|nr:TonB-dependent receptor [Pirellulales bacterium]